MELSRLKIGDEDFLVASMIERCPKVMMLRELVKNGLEATEGAVAGDRRVEIGPLDIAGVRKLAIWNTGPGMTAEELFRMCDIASSIGKTNSLEQNFGMGAKVASLPSNQHGIRYRSCRNGQVHQVMMGKRGGHYGRVRQQGPDGSLADVIDATEAAVADGRGLEHDWTEVVLLGNRPDQDTIADPYDGAPGVEPSWLTDDLSSRFYAIPKGVQVILHPGAQPRGDAQTFQPLADRLQAYERHDAVLDQRGVRFHYIFDAPDPERPRQTRSSRDALQPALPGAAILYRGEFYDWLRDWRWIYDSPSFGFPFGARNFTLLVELPDDYHLLPDAYRQFLRYRENAQSQVEVRHFAAEIARHRPDWVLDLLRRLTPDGSHAESARGGMSALFARLGIRRRWWPPGSPAGSPGAGEGDGIEYEVAPQIVALRDPTDIQERGLQNRAARFYRDTHQLFMNFSYAGVEKLRQQLETEFATVEDHEKLREAALLVAELTITSLVCRKLVYALAKRGEWQEWELEHATTAPSLTVAADDHDAELPKARLEMANRLGIPEPVTISAESTPAIEVARQHLAEAMKALLTAGRVEVG